MRASSAGGGERVLSQRVASMASMCGAFVGVDPLRFDLNNILTNMTYGVMVQTKKAAYSSTRSAAEI